MSELNIKTIACKYCGKFPIIVDFRGEVSIYCDNPNCKSTLIKAIENWNETNKE